MRIEVQIDMDDDRVIDAMARMLLEISKPQPATDRVQEKAAPVKRKPAGRSKGDKR